MTPQYLQQPSQGFNVFEYQLTDDEFRQWRASPRSKKTTLRHVLLTHAYTSMKSLLQPAGSSFGLGEQLRMKPYAKLRWSLIHSEHFGIALNTNGKVVIKGSVPGEFQLWIKPNGDAGTNSRNKLTGDQLANEWLIFILIGTIRRIQARPRKAGEPKFLCGLIQLLRKAVEALNFRRYVFPCDEDSCKFFYKKKPSEWPF